MKKYTGAGTGAVRIVTTTATQGGGMFATQGGGMF
ncbi:MAG: hypothetical protein QOI41_5743 [Myxococcales bacterium]|nr:hypothetical protein [Myxococcales bacterium]